jgi:hypothetical protein
VEGFCGVADPKGTDQPSQVSWLQTNHQSSCLFVEGFWSVVGSLTCWLCSICISSAAKLKVTEDIRLSIEDGQVTVLLLLDFSQAFDMVVLCKLLNAHTENYLSLIFRKFNDFVHRFILGHKSVDFTILVVNNTILYCLF